MHHTLALVLVFIGVCHSLSMKHPMKISSSSSSSQLSSSQQPRGCAKTPFDKQKVAVFGGGGYLAGCAFGFLQRCSSLYGSGIGGVRNIGATAVCADNLNRILGKSFLLAFAGEDMQRLTDMTNVQSLKQRLQGFSAVIMGTEYYLERRPVTGNTYETSPNSKTLEFYLDSPRRGMDEDDMVVNPDYQSLLFENTLQAGRETGSVKHFIVVEAPNTTLQSAKHCAQLLDESQVPFTYLKVCGPLETTHDYTFSKGVQSDLGIESFTFAQDYTTIDGYVSGSWITDLHDASERLSASSIGENAVPREDVAALVVQCLQSLDWSTSRCLVVSSGGKLQATEAFKGRVDKEWCIHSAILADKLEVVQ